MNSFIINGIVWNVCFVSSNSSELFRSDGSRTVGMTDWNTKTIYLDKHLKGAFLEKVLCHELCHVFCFSYHIHMGLEQEEFLANWIANYGRDVIELLDDLLYKTNYRGHAWS